MSADLTPEARTLMGSLGGGSVVWNGISEAVKLWPCKKEASGISISAIAFLNYVATRLPTPEPKAQAPDGEVESDIARLMEYIRVIESDQQPWPFLVGQLQSTISLIQRLAGERDTHKAIADAWEQSARKISQSRDETESELSRLRAEVEEMRAEIADLKSSVIAFCAPWAVTYARDFGMAAGELHPTHFDILERCGARMDDFRRAAALTGGAS